MKSFQWSKGEFVLSFFYNGFNNDKKNLNFFYNFNNDNKNLHLHFYYFCL